MRTYQRTVSAEYAGGLTVAVKFENGVKGLFDFAPFADYSCYQSLKSNAIFAAVRADHGTLMWPGDIDIAPEAVWENSEMLST